MRCVTVWTLADRLMGWSADSASAVARDAATATAGQEDAERQFLQEVEFAHCAE